MRRDLWNLIRRLWYGKPCRLCGGQPCQDIHLSATRREDGSVIEPQPEKGPPTPQPYPGPWAVYANPFDRDGFARALDERNAKIDAWDAAERERVAREYPE